MHQQLMKCLGRHSNMPVRLHMSSGQVVEGVIGIVGGLVETPENAGVRNEAGRPFTPEDVAVIFTFEWLTNTRTNEERCVPHVVFTSPSAIVAFEPSLALAKEEIEAIKRASKGDLDPEGPREGALKPEDLRDLGIDP